MRAALAVLALATGCELIANIPNPTIVDPDAPPGGGCMLDADCMAPTPVCDTSAKRCVECTQSAQCGAAAPVCAMTTQTCRACGADDECAAGVCLPDGTCPDASRFLYAAAAGGGDVCSSAAPCTLDVAVSKLSATTDIVKMVPGMYQRAATLAVTAPGIIAGGGSTLVPLDTNPLAMIRVTGVAAQILGLTVRPSANSPGIQCQQSGSLRVSRTTIEGGSTGILGSTCTLLALDRVVVTGTANYGIAASSSAVEIANSFIIRCGTAASTYGGLALLDATGTIEHTTIADNVTETQPAGIYCTTNGVQIKNVISWGNANGGISPACAVSTSIVEAGVVGMGVMSANPLFEAPATGDYHLLDGSPAEGLGSMSTLVVDADGEARPRPAGSSPDVGADEIE